MSIPQGLRSAGFRVFCDLLQSDPVLKREVRTFQTWTGSLGDVSEVSGDQCPYVTLTPKPDQASWLDTCTAKSPLIIQIDIWLRGSRIDDGLDFWEEMESVLFSKSAQAKLVAAGFSTLEPMMPSYGVENKGGAIVLHGSGQIRLQFYPERGA